MKLAQSQMSVNEDVCWDFVISGGKCTRKDCRFVHKLVSVSQVPISLRADTFSTRDSFPAERREESTEKVAVNTALVKLSATLANKRCLVLDGENLMSTQFLLACPVQKRGKGDIAVPNSCSETYLAMKRQDLCTAHFGSLRSYIDLVTDDRMWHASGDEIRPDGGAEAETRIKCDLRLEISDEEKHEGEVGRESHSNQPQMPSPQTVPQPQAFGLLYCDYCCSLYSGKHNIEKSPVSDLTALFDAGLVDSQGAVLAITLAKPTNRTEQEVAGQPQQLTKLVMECAGRRGIAVEQHDCDFDFDGTFVSIYLCNYGSPSE